MTILVGYRPPTRPIVTDYPGDPVENATRGNGEMVGRRRICPRFRRVKIAVAKETRDGESRVAMVPELVGKLTALGYDVAVEPGAGLHALIADEEYAEAGATIDADALAERRPRGLGPAAGRRRRSVGCAEARPTISFLPTTTEQADRRRPPRRRHHRVRDGAGAAHLPRPVDGRASARRRWSPGYRCAIVAAGMLRRFFPLNMTAAGTVQAAEVVVLGAGVAGLQAIATAKRLGAVVRAYDVRAAAAEEIRSMGAKSIDLDLETLEGAGGYAREMTEDRAARQRELLTPYIAAADALITTAAVPGPAGADAGDPRDGRADEARLGRRRPGRRDAAATSRARWPARSSGSATPRCGAGATCPSQMPGPASKLYAQNIVNLVTLMTDQGRRRHGGVRARLRRRDRLRQLRHPRRAIVHEPTREAIEGTTAPSARRAPDRRAQPNRSRATASSSISLRPGGRPVIDPASSG